MQQGGHRFVAAATRFVLASAALLALPQFFPNLGVHLPVFAAYIVVSAIFQVLIWRDIGGDARAILSGLVDVAMVTFIVHRVGSVATMLVAAYFFAAVVNTLVVGRRVGLALAVAGALGYGGLLVAEGLALLPFAPDAFSYASASRPTFAEYLGAGITMGVMQVGASVLVGRLVAENERKAHELAEANRRLLELSVRDPLTKLYNRRYLMERLESELGRVRRGRPLAAVMLDLDGFKHVNDTRGHQAGDALLAQLADALAECVRATDVVGRYGGDEFVVVLPDTEAEAAETACRRVVEAVRQVGLDFDAAHPVTASVGLAIARADDDARGLLQRADRAAYGAKSGGGDRVERESLAPVRQLAAMS